ncbi:hypothetical protein PENTCL1PPCAC_8250, partial [Pristionchus entomophagus]
QIILQSLCQVIPLFCAILTYHLIGVTQTSEWGLFLSYTFSWGMLHAVDGIVLVAFHAKLPLRVVAKFNQIWPEGGRSSAKVDDQQQNSFTLATVTPVERTVRWSDRQKTVRAGQYRP